MLPRRWLPKNLIPRRIKVKGKGTLIVARIVARLRLGYDDAAVRARVMSNGFIEIDDIESLDRFLAEANGSLSVILKHSDTCGISARAYQDM